MFHSARISLTAWYLVIIMTISVVFSVGFYNVATQEFRRIIRIQEFRQEHPEDMIVRPRAIIIRPPNIQDLEEASKRLRVLLIGLNVVIFVVTGAAGYFLAGRTLRPIRVMVDEQKRFITDASHELRTPLTSLRSEIEVNLRNKTLTLNQAKKLLASNLEDVMNLQSLSDHLLALTQTGKNGASVTESILLSDALDSAIKRLNGIISKKGIMIQRDIDELRVQAISETLVELFVILLDNAVKYSPAKSTVTVSAKKTEKEIAIVVVDEGVGIAKEDLPHIFDRFYRANTSRSKEQVKGYGLGLSIAKKIVTSQKGTISVISELGKGTAFTIYLPTK